MYTDFSKLKPGCEYIVSDKYNRNFKSVIGKFVGLEDGYDEGEKYVIFKVKGREIKFSDQNNLYEEAPKAQHIFLDLFK